MLSDACIYEYMGIFHTIYKQCEISGSYGGEDFDVGLLVATPCGLAGRLESVGGTYCLHLRA
jgi:hypothetical protein